MNTISYEKESSNLLGLISQLFNFVDRVRGELELSSYEEQTGRNTYDALDPFKGVFRNIENRVNNNNISMDFLYKNEQTFNYIKQAFASDPTITNLLDNISRSLWRLFHYLNDDIDDVEEDTDY